MTTAELPEEMLELVARLLVTRRAKKDIEAEEKELRDMILQVMEENEVTTGLTASGNVAVELVSQVRRTVNRAKLEAVYPEVFESVVEEKPVVIVKVNDVAY